MSMVKLGMVRQIIKKGLNAIGLEVRRFRPSSSGDSPRYSNFGEQEVAAKFLSQLSPHHRFCVDIGAADGATSSNSYALFQSGWSGLAVETDSDRFAKLAYRHAELPSVQLLRTKATPENILSILRAAGTPREFGFLSLDIDSYDYFVLEQILTEFCPSLICAEINEKIPPPVKFSVKWDPNHAWSHDHFYGQSISMLEGLAIKNDYSLVGLEYNNAFLIPSSLSTVPAVSAKEAYRTGYFERADRRTRLPWNKDMEVVLGLSPEGARDFVEEHFSAYRGKFVCEI